MTKWFFLSLLMLLLTNSVAVTAHQHLQGIATAETAQQNSSLSSKGDPLTEQSLGKPQSWLEWLGSFHLVFVHFPIALLNMAALSELLYARYGKSLFNDATRFMLIAGAILAIPTAILGLIYSYAGHYEGIFAELLRWHMWFGIATATLAVITAYLRETEGTTKLYYGLLFTLFLIVNITGMLGGNLVFGPYHLALPT